jgi:hypothetical protein
MLTNLSLFADNIRIRGVIKNDKEQIPVEMATVSLFSNDSTFLEGYVTDQYGKFQLKKVPVGNSYIVIACLGYETTIIYLENIQEDFQIDDIYIIEASENLDEIMVVSDRVINQVNRQIIFPSLFEKESSSTALELLSKMMLPGLIVSTVQNSITSMVNGGLQLRINNVVSNIQDLLALTPDDILKIEYIDKPGVRYGEGLATIINFITKRKNKGVSGGISLRNAVTTGYGNDNIYLKYNNKASEFSINYELSYRSFRNKYSDIRQELLLSDNRLREIKKTGIHSPYKLQEHNFSLNYNWISPEKSVFNVKLDNNLHRIPEYSIIQSVKDSENEVVMAHTNIYDKSYSPVLDIYYQVNLSKNQNLTTNFVGTYIMTDYSYGYSEHLSEDTPFIPSMNYSADGNKYSFISELIYDNELNNNLSWSSGINYKQAHTNNTYQGSTGGIATKMDDSKLYLYSELSGSLHKLEYNIGIGFSSQYFKESSHKYAFNSFQPTAFLAYPIFKGAYLRYTFSIGTVLPSLSALSNVEKWQNNYEVHIGNPDLKPYRAYRNTLNLEYRIGRFSFQTNGYYQHTPNPIISTSAKRIDEEEYYYYVYSSANQKSMTHLQGLLNLRVEVIKNILSISVYGGVNRYINKGFEYSNTYTGYFGNVQIEAMYRNLMLSASVKPRMSYKFGETENYSPAGADVSVSYKYNSLRVGLGILNPFFSNGEKSGQQYLSSIVKKETFNYTKDLGNMIYLTFSWNFFTGRKHTSGEQQLYNSDSESGVVK